MADQSSAANAGSGADITWSGQVNRFRLPDTADGCPPGRVTTWGSPQACFQSHHAPPYWAESSAAAYR